MLMSGSSSRKRRLPHRIPFAARGQRRICESSPPTGRAGRHAGLPIVPIRRVLPRAPRGRCDPPAPLCADPAREPLQLPFRANSIAADAQNRIMIPPPPSGEAMRAAKRLVLSFLAAALCPQPALAQAAPAPVPELVLPPIEVIAPTPLLGSGVDRAKVPAETSVLTSQDITRTGPANALGALNQQVPGAALDSMSGNPFQPSLFYHGFQASPLQGNQQGLAVYVNGERFNQPFGDTVNWDLIPNQAIDRLNLVGSNPVFGLNALGGSVAVQMKNGFTYHGGEIDLLGGSFGKYQGEFQYGLQSGNVATYVAAGGLHEDGWRQTQSSDLANFFGDIGWRGNRGELHASVTAADDRLNQPGTTPVQLLAVNPAAVFTAPNLITNRYANLNVTGRDDISDRTSLQGNIYYDSF
jgi:iron complex outermembrane receptor protein